MDEPHIRVCVGPRHDADMRSVDLLGVDDFEDMASGTVVAHNTDVGGLYTCSLGVNRHIEGLSTRKHHAQIAVAVDDVVAYASQLHG